MKTTIRVTTKTEKNLAGGTIWVATINGVRIAKGSETKVNAVVDSYAARQNLTGGTYVVVRS